MSADEIVVAPTGHAAGSGSARDPVGDLTSSIALARARRAGAGVVRIVVHAGRYRIAEPIVLDHRDSGTVIEAADDSSPVLVDGSVALRGWEQRQCSGRRVWVSHDASRQSTRSLFARGRRLSRPRFPRADLLPMTGQDGLDLSHGPFDDLYQGSDRFRYSPQSIPTLAYPTDVDVVVPHYWVQERMPIVAVDDRRSEIRSSHRSIFALRDSTEPRYAQFYLDNVRESFGEVPGEWYRDGATGAIYYLPTPEDDIIGFEAVAPTVHQLLRVDGDASGEPVRDVVIRGIDFCYANWQQPSRPQRFGIPEDDLLPADVPLASAPQAAADVPAAIELRGLRDSSIDGCRVRHVGGYGIALGCGCQGIEIGASTLSDLGAGGISLDGAPEADDAAACGHNTVRNNRVLSGGHIFPQGVGILLRRSAANIIEHNEVSDLHYSGISCGWTWGYAAPVAAGNQIRNNHVHHVGLGTLADLGGIYVVGNQPNTRVVANLVHDVAGASYGGWGIYLDEGATGVVVSHNVVYGTTSEDLHLHFGRDNLVENNVLGRSDTGTLSITRREPHLQLTLRRNVIVISNGIPVGDTVSGRRGDVVSDGNLFVPAYDQGLGTAPEVLNDWRAAGFDRHSTWDGNCRIEESPHAFDPSRSASARRLGIDPITTWTHQPCTDEKSVPTREGHTA